MASARVLLEVQAGLLVGDPEPEFTKRWVITSEEWHTAGDPELLLAERNGEATAYAGRLMMQPDRLNWVRVDWIWL